MKAGQDKFEGRNENWARLNKSQIKDRNESKKRTSSNIIDSKDSVEQAVELK